MKNRPLNVIFAGTPDFAVPSLKALLSSPHQVLAVYTQPDRPAGRGQKTQSSPIKQIALANNIPIEQPQTLRDPNAQLTLAEYQPDVMIVAAYGLILPPAVLAIPHFGCINVHASLLPRWRGAAPIQRAILAGDNESGVTIMQMDAGLDTGTMLLKRSCVITSRMNAKQLQDQIAFLGAEALIEVLNLLSEQRLQPIAQEEKLVTYANKIVKDEARIHWHLGAEDIDRMVRAFNPWPVTFTQLNDKTLRIWSGMPVIDNSEAIPGKILSLRNEGIIVACGNNSFCIQQLQFPGGKIISAGDAINAKRIQIGQVLI